MAINRKPILSVGLTLLLAACTSTAAPNAKGTHPPMTPSQIAVVADTCPLRLQDIEGAMLLYYSTHAQRLPRSLEDLRASTKAVAGTDLQLTCPDSGVPFIYAPDGIPVEGQKWIIFVYDPDSAHNGIHWTIVAPAEDANGAVTLRVVPMDDKTLQAYINSSLVHP